ARLDPRLPEQRGALPDLSAVLPDAPAAALGDLGQERPAFPPARRRSLQARHPRCGGALSGHRPLRVGNPLRGDRRADAGLYRPSRRSLTLDESARVGHNDMRASRTPQRAEDRHTAVDVIAARERETAWWRAGPPGHVAPCFMRSSSM